MRIALIWPKGLSTKVVLPLALGYLKSNIDNREHDVKIFDCALHDISSCMLRELVSKFNPQLVGVSCWSETYLESKRILEIVKSINSDIITVAGGTHATFNAAKIIQDKNVDFVFRGEAETYFSEFVDEIQKKNPDLSRIRGLTYRSRNGDIINNEVYWKDNLDEINLPDYDGIDLDGYIERGYRCQTRNRRNAPLWITRGCPYECDYCTAPMHNGRKVRRHSVEYVIKWVKRLYYDKRIRTFNIIDDNFTFDVNYAKDLCRGIIKLNLRGLHFGDPNGVRMQRLDQELLHLMKQVGWEYVTIAPETGSIKTLKRMKKNLDPAIVPKKIKEIKDAGLKVMGFFMVGYPGETQKDMEDTARLIRDCKLDFFFISNFQPLPGTPIYNELLEKGEIPLDYLPSKYPREGIPYVPEALRDFNFSFFRLKAYLHLVITKPSTILYIVKNFSLAEVKKGVFFNLLNMLRPKAKPKMRSFIE